MLIINRTKKEKEYRMPKMPNFEQKKVAIAWLKEQKREAELANIKSIGIQIKDIKQMIYSQNFRMLSLHAKYHRNSVKTNQNEEDYIIITKSKKGNKKESVNKELIYDIITSDWIINVEEIENKSTPTLENELKSIESEIQKLNIKLTKNSFSKNDITCRIKLLEYKYACISDYLSKRETNNKIRKLINK